MKAEGAQVRAEPRNGSETRAPVAYIDSIWYARMTSPELESYLGPEWASLLPELNLRPTEPSPGDTAGELSPPAEAEQVVVWPRDAAALTSIRNPYLAAELARAANEWMVEQVLPRESRLLGSILVATHLPQLAAEEIRQRAQHRQMRQVVVASNALGRTLGHPVYRPIVEACAETALPLAVESGTVLDAGREATAGGSVGTDLERRVLASESLMTHLLGLVSNGVFESFPDLRVVLSGGGIAWLASVLWRLDVNFKGVHREIPWVTSTPSETVAEHVRLTTFPIEEAPPGELAKLVEFAGGPQLLVYGSGGPGDDAEPVARILAVLPEEWAEPVVHGNARALYGD